MKALLINPHKLIPISMSTTLKASPPLGLAYIAAAIENAGWEVSTFDCIAEAPESYRKFEGHEDISVLGISFEEMFKKLEPSYDMIGMSIMFSNNWLINRELINELKKRYPNAVMVAGGEHISPIPEYSLKDCPGLDIAVIGEGEETIEALAKAIMNGETIDGIDGIVYKSFSDRNKIITNPARKRIRTLDAIARPAWHLFPLDKYFENNISYGIAYGNSLPIFSTRGCPYECTFCSSPSMWGLKYNMRTVDNVIQEIKYLNSTYNVTNFDFYDLTAIINRKWILEFCDRLKEEELKITWQIPAGTRSEAIDYRVAKALKENGCRNITYAPETGSKEMLLQIKKKVTTSRMLESIDESYKAGLNIKLNIMMGYPEEKISDIFMTMWFLVKASYFGTTDASPGMFSPYPGSALFNELRERKELELSDDYFESMVFTQSFFKVKNYNRHNSKATMITMLFMIYLAFYISNYLFRPVRAFRLVRNLITQKYETRGEYMLSEILKRRKKNLKMA